MPTMAYGEESKKWPHCLALAKVQTSSAKHITTTSGQWTKQLRSHRESDKDNSIDSRDSAQK
eukprot:scaffold248393_cov85-Cyclotella_meneghiniana.AAC.8